MRILTTFAALLLVGLACSNPVTKSDVMIITDDFFPDSLVQYTAQNNIIRLFTPLNELNFSEDDDDDEANVYIFFVEGDKNNEGDTVYKGLSILKNGKATKLLENGKDMAAPNGDNKDVYLAASDGIYLYNDKTNGAEKYGTVNEDIVGIEVENSTGVIYILTNNNKVYKVTEEGTVKEQLSEIQNAKQITVDYAGNLFYVDTEDQVYVYTEDGVKKIEGIPSHPSYVQLVRPPFVLDEGVPLIIGKKAFTILPNGTADYSEVNFNVYPTAYSMEATLIQYYAYNKKIYEFNILALILGELLEDLKSFLGEKVDDIQSLATRSRKEFR
ncbi:unnamed protein product [Diatraea saccharalis]|uniref:Lipoprotein n=1 Tax=Diatraea saccharalis TaxID=40085 RepID=A0A9N9WES0_9NEOP|nr:unnamed protein product [Diatraea saccharalis]